MQEQQVYSHLQVHEDNIEVAVLFELPDSGSAMLGDDDLVSVLLQSLRDNHAVDHLVPTSWKSAN